MTAPPGLPEDARPAEPTPSALARLRVTPWRRWALIGLAVAFAVAAQHNFAKGPVYFEDAFILGSLALASVVALEWRGRAHASRLALTEVGAIAVLAIAGLAMALRLVELDRLPAEMWGDAIEHEKLALQAQQGTLTLAYHFGGDGPLFSYFVAFVAKAFGLSFYTLKLATGIIGTLLTVAIFFLARELFEQEEIAYLAAFISAVSFWSLSWSRQAKPHILVPLLIAVAVLCALTGRRLLAGIALGLGFYTQAGFWGAVLIPMGGLSPYVAALLIVMPLRTSLLQELAGGSGGFFTEKLGGASLGPLDFAGRVLENLWKNLLSFNVTGDNVFRHNIPGHPHLDALSGLLFLLGVGLILWRVVRERNGRLLVYFVVPLAVVQIPSVMDVANPASIPNMGRMIGLLPFVYMAVAYGLQWVARLIPDRALGNTLIAACLGWITLTNAYNFFVVFPHGLPENNTPFGRTIAETLAEYPPQLPRFLIGCCWGGYGQPEPFGISFNLPPDQQAAFRHIDNTGERLTCDLVLRTAPGDRAVFVLTPHDAEADAALDQVAGCVTRTTTRTLKRAGYDVATLVEARLRR